MTYSRVGFFGGLFVLSILIPLSSFAAEFRTGDQPSLRAEESITNDLYLAGGSVTSAGAIQGDLIAGGGTILINGAVSADVVAGGGSVTIINKIGGDLRFGGGTIIIQGEVVGDVVGAGGQVTLAGPQIGGDVAVAGGSVSIDSPITGSLRVAGGEVRINAPVKGDVLIQAEKVTLGPKAAIAGNLTYTATDAVTLENGAVVTGLTKFNKREDIRELTKTGIAAFFTAWIFAKLLMSLVGALLVGMLFVRYSRELVATAAQQPLMEMLRGLIFMIVLPVASIILIATVLGIPFGILGLLIFIATCIFVNFLAPIVTGAIVHKWIWKPAGYEVTAQTILLGVLVYFVLGLIPVLGGVLKFGIMLLALGAALKIKGEIMSDWR